MLRKVNYEEMSKRGCCECVDMVKQREEEGWFCPHPECPYHELDEYDSYGEYLKAHKNIFAEMLGE